MNPEATKANEVIEIALNELRAREDIHSIIINLVYQYDVGVCTAHGDDDLKGEGEWGA